MGRTDGRTDGQTRRRLYAPPKFFGEHKKGQISKHMLCIKQLIKYYFTTIILLLHTLYTSNVFQKRRYK